MSLLSPLCVVDLGSSVARMWDVDSGKQIAVRSTLIERGRLVDDLGMGPYIRSLWTSLVRRPLAFARPRLIFAVPCALSAVEKQAFVRAGMAAGAGSVALVSNALCAAYGSGIDLNNARATIMFSCGAGFSELAVVISGTQVMGIESRCTSENLVSALSRAIKKKLNVWVDVAALLPVLEKHDVLDPKAKDETVAAKRCSDASFCEITIPQTLIVETATVFFNEIAAQIKYDLRGLSPALAVDVMEQGMLLYGGLAQVHTLPLLLASCLHIPVSVVPEPENCVLMGLKELASSITFDDSEVEKSEPEVLGCSL